MAEMTYVHLGELEKNVIKQLAWIFDPVINLQASVESFLFSPASLKTTSQDLFLQEYPLGIIECRKKKDKENFNKPW